MDTSPSWFTSLHRWIYRCEDIVLEPRSNRLERDGRLIFLESKAYAVLTMMMEHPYVLIDKNTLLDAVWGHRSVSPEVLARVISTLRRALDDSSAHPRFIATVYHLGYCFIGQVDRELIGSPPLAITPDRRQSADRRQANDRRAIPRKRAH